MGLPIVQTTNTTIHSSGRTSVASSLRLLAFGVVKSALVFGLCAILLATATVASSSLPPSRPFVSDGRGGGGAASVDETEYEYDHVPWQSSPTTLENIDEAARYEDMPPSVFSPTGRLHPVEAAVRASKTPTNNLLVAMKCKDGLLVVSTLCISPHVDARIANANATSSTNANDSDSGSNNDTSLFLFHDTCTSTVTVPIFDIHPCIVGATAGNAVDNRILRTKLLGVGWKAVETQGSLEDDLTAGRVAKDLANQLQVVTQDIAAAQKQRLGRMLASSAVILGSRQIWRIDPTGQFWDCHATVVGQDADRIEEEFYKRLLEECQTKQLEDKNIPKLLDSLSQKEALALVEDFLQSRMAKTKPQTSLSQPSSSSRATKESSSSHTKEAEAKSDDSLLVVEPEDLHSQIYWQAVILDYSSLTRRGRPRKRLKRGVFGVRN